MDTNRSHHDGSDRSDRSDASRKWKRLRPSGGYRELRSFQTATIVYDATASFCERFVPKSSRTYDQMIQGARSGRQNIAEGSRAAASSSQTELRLVNVARNSLEELLLDYEDYLRQRRLRIWGKDDPEALEVRQVAKQESPCAEHYASWLNHADPAVVANALICLIHQANYLLQRQLEALERDFVEQGGYSEQLAAERIAERDKQRRESPPNQSDRTDPTDQSDPTSTALPACPVCGKPMVLRTARKGSRAGSQFWGCSSYPDCKGTRGFADSE